MLKIAEPVTAAPAASDGLPATMPVRAANVPHVAFLDGLRGLAALYVMFHHAWLTVWTDPAQFPTGMTGVLTNWLAFGHLSVTVFIVISGFCLMLPVARCGGTLRGGALAFFKRRARRIIPPYYAAIALSCILMLTVIGKYTGTHWDVSIPYNRHDAGKALITHLLLIQDFFDAYTINHAFWSIAVEWQIYFVFPLLLLLWRRPGPIVTTAAMLVFAFWAQDHAIIASGQIEPSNVHYIGFWQKSVHHLFRVLGRLEQVNFHYFGLFALGMLAASASFATTGPLVWLRSPWALRVLSVVSALSAAAIVITLHCLNIVAGISHWLLIDFLAGIATSTLMLTACHLPVHPVRDFLSLRPLVWLGTFSYSLYLVHAPLIQVAWQYAMHPYCTSKPVSFAILAAISATFIIAFAYLFYLVCERPFLNTRVGTVPSASPIVPAS
jgi:peptidoglycan/LPS O-acetylase OafA/YrhL